MADEQEKLAQAEAKAAPQGPQQSVTTMDKDKPQHSHYEVIVDTWGHDRADRLAPKRGDVLTADEVGPHHKWALANNVIAPLDAKEAKARLGASVDTGPNAITNEDDAEAAEKKTLAAMEANAHNPEDDLDTMARKATARIAVDLRRTQAAEGRSNRDNLRRV